MSALGARRLSEARRLAKRKLANWRAGLHERVVELQWMGEAPRFRGPGLNDRLDAIEKLIARVRP